MLDADSAVLGIHAMGLRHGFDIQPSHTAIGSSRSYSTSASCPVRPRYRFHIRTRTWCQRADTFRSFANQESGNKQRPRCDCRPSGGFWHAARCRSSSRLGPGKDHSLSTRVRLIVVQRFGDQQSSLMHLNAWHQLAFSQSLLSSRASLLRPASRYLRLLCSVCKLMCLQMSTWPCRTC